MGYALSLQGETIDAYTLVSEYRIPADKYAVMPDGPDYHYQRILREFFLRTLHSASLAMKRRDTDPMMAG